MRQVGKTLGDSEGLPVEEEPEVPELRYVFDWFVELNEARAEGMASVRAISFSEIKAWSDLTGSAPIPFEVKLLRRLDNLYRDINAPKER